jgi:hypothetical protein
MLQQTFSLSNRLQPTLRQHACISDTTSRPFSLLSSVMFSAVVFLF